MGAEPQQTALCAVLLRCFLIDGAEGCKLKVHINCKVCGLCANLDCEHESQCHAAEAEDTAQAPFAHLMRISTEPSGEKASHIVRSADR